MLFEFKEMTKSSILIQKISPNYYIFGTKKIFGKVSNGVLLIRVGGGFMDIESFYKTYGEQEIIKQEREELRKNGGIKFNPNEIDDNESTINLFSPTEESPSMTG